MRFASVAAALHLAEDENSISESNYIYLTEALPVIALQDRVTGVLKKIRRCLLSPIPGSLPIFFQDSALILKLRR